MKNQKLAAFALILLLAILILSADLVNAHIEHSDGSSSAWPADGTPPGCNWGMCDHAVDDPADLGTEVDCWTATGVQGLYNSTCPPPQFSQVNWWHEGAVGVDGGGQNYWYFYEPMTSTYTINYSYTQFAYNSSEGSWMEGYGGYNGIMRRGDFNSSIVLNDVTAASGITFQLFFYEPSYQWFNSASWTPAVYAWMEE